MTSRDRASTQKKILQAVKILLEEGSEDLGINRIAERAGVDKVLIYRYFGGLPGLLEAFSQENVVWPEFEEILETAPYVAAMLSEAEFGSRFVHGFIRELKLRPLTQEILRRELVRQNDLTRETARLREERLNELLECLHGQDKGLNPLAPDLLALVAAGLIYLILHAKTSEEFCGIPLRTSEGWERIERAAAMIPK